MKIDKKSKILFFLFAFFLCSGCSPVSLELEKHQELQKEYSFTENSGQEQKKVEKRKQNETVHQESAHHETPQAKEGLFEQQKENKNRRETFREDTSDASIPEEESLQEASREETKQTKSVNSSEWLQSLQSFGGTGEEKGNSVAIDQQENIFLVGAFQKSIRFASTQLKSRNTKNGDAVYVTKLDKTGKVRWAKEFSGSTTSLRGTKVRIGSKGSVFVMGTFSGTLYVDKFSIVSNKAFFSPFVVKMDSQGKVLWVFSLDGKSHSGMAIAESMALDSQENLYFIGYFQQDIKIGSNVHRSKGVRNVFLVKLSSQGKVLWSKVFSGNHDSTGEALAIDKHGNIFILGNYHQTFHVGKYTFSTLENSVNFFVAKLNTQGNVVWAVSSEEKGHHKGEDIVVDEQGNITVTGRFQGALRFGSVSYQHSYYAAFLLRLDKSGQLRWFRNFLYSSLSTGSSVLVDKQGNSYVTGYFQIQCLFGTIHLTTQKNSAVFLAKVDTQGKVSWAIAPTGGKKGESSEGLDIAQGSKDQLYLIGTFAGKLTFGQKTLGSTGRKDIFLATFNQVLGIPSCRSNDDCPLAYHCEQGSCEVNHAQSCSSQIYPTCSSSSKYVQCHLSNGSLHRSSGFCVSGETCVRRSCRKSCQKSSDCGSQHFCSDGYCYGTKYEQIYFFDNPPIGGFTLTQQKQDDNHIFVSGLFSSSVTKQQETLVSKGDSDGFLAKTTSKGKVVWMKSFGGEGRDSIRALTTDTQGNIFIAGHFEKTIENDGHSLTSNGKSDSFVAKVESQGKTLWMTSFGGTGYESVTSIVVGKQGHIFIAGYFQKSMTAGNVQLKSSQASTDLFLMKLQPQGKVVWATSFGGVKSDSSASILLDTQGNIYFSGVFRETMKVGQTLVKGTKNKQIFVTKLSSQGTVLWATPLLSSKTSDAPAMVIDKSGTLYMTGSFQESIKLGAFTLRTKQTSAIFVVTLNPQGRVNWATSFSPETRYMGNNAIALDKNGKIYIAGDYGQKIEAGQKLLTTATDEIDIFVICINRLGKVDWAESVGKKGVNDMLLSLAVNNDGSVSILERLSTLLLQP